MCKVHGRVRNVIKIKYLKVHFHACQTIRKNPSSADAVLFLTMYVHRYLRRQEGAFFRFPPYFTL